MTRQVARAVSSQQLQQLHELEQQLALELVGPEIGDSRRQVRHYSRVMQ